MNREVRNVSKYCDFLHHIFNFKKSGGVKAIKALSFCPTEVSTVIQYQSCTRLNVTDVTQELSARFIATQ
jgi:hypothetical protein